MNIIRHEMLCNPCNKRIELLENSLKIEETKVIHERCYKITYLIDMENYSFHLFVKIKVNGCRIFQLP